MPPVLEPYEVAALAHDAGLRGDDLVTAVAVAGPESGYDVRAKGDEHLVDDKWGPSLGLWQIRTLHEQRGTGGPRDADRLYDPRHNAMSMAAIRSTSRGWNHWTAYSNGSYRNYLGRARDAVARLGEERDIGAVSEGIMDRVGDVIGEAADRLPIPGGGTVGGAVDAFRTLTSGETWMRVLMAVAGLGAIVIALVLLSRDALGGALGTVADVAGGRAGAAADAVEAVAA